MTRQSQDVEFLIITPTYHRESLLVRFLKQVKSQTYGCWRLLVVHDGPNPLTEQLVGRFRALDPRIEYLNIPTRGNDFGVTPRLEALRHAVRTHPPDYAVSWDDDDYFVRPRSRPSPQASRRRTILRSCCLPTASGTGSSLCLHQLFRAPWQRQPARRPIEGAL